MVKISYGIILLLLCTSQALAEGHTSPWYTDLSVYAITDDNINRAEAKWDQESDSILGVSADASYTRELSVNKSLVYSAGLAHESYEEWTGLSSTVLNTKVEYRFRTRGSFTAPIYSLFISLEGRDYKSELRDGNQVVAGLSVFKRLTDKVVFTGGVDVKERDADADVFDITNQRVYAVFDYSFGASHSLYLQYQFLDGDIVSSSRPTQRINAARPYWKAWQQDDAFSTRESLGTGLGYQSVDRFAYRFDAETNIVSIGYSLPVGHNKTLQLTFDDYDSEAQGDINYQGERARIDLLFRF